MSRDRHTGPDDHKVQSKGGEEHLDQPAGAGPRLAGARSARRVLWQPWGPHFEHGLYGATAVRQVPAHYPRHSRHPSMERKCGEYGVCYSVDCSASRVPLYRLEWSSGVTKWCKMKERLSSQCRDPTRLVHPTQRRSLSLPTIPLLFPLYLYPAESGHLPLFAD